MSIGGSSQNPFQAPAPGYSQKPFSAPYRQKKNVAAGVASIVIGVLSLLSICGPFAWMFVLIAQFDGRRPPTDSAAAGVLGLVMLAGIGMSLIGAIVGLVGVIVPTQNKVVAVIGLLINGLLFIGTVGLIALGVAVRMA